MAVQQLINGKVIIKKDGAIFNQQSKKKEKKVKLTNFYEESYTNKTGNIDVDELATAITARMLGGNARIPKTKVIEVDIQREIAVGKIDTDAVKSEEIKGKVNNKLNKLRKLRQKNGS
jgi:hypothetical protein